MSELDRRTAIKWVMAASAALKLPSVSFDALAATPATQGYGKDPDLMKVYKAGELWPLTFSKEQRATATALSDLIIPADDTSPAASSVGVVDFIDEWISAPYPQQRGDRDIVLPGLAWMEDEARRRFGNGFAAVTDLQRARIADDICSASKAKPAFAAAAKFFAKFRDLTAGGFYTTPIGMKDIGYVGNVPLERFDGPPIEALKKAGLA
jgi:hypothetical protein